ncbi:MAG: hypothetical protein ACI957_004421 [Verrucomicrobiales bacterium]|jgi:hypothetical protein
MQIRNGNLHLEIQTSRKNPVGILRTSFRDKSTGKISHSQHGRITGCSLEQLRLLQAAFRDQVQPVVILTLSASWVPRNTALLASCCSWPKTSAFTESSILAPNIGLIVCSR